MEAEERQKTMKAWELTLITWRGHKVDIEGAVPDYKYMCNKPEGKFLKVKQSNRDLMNIWVLIA